MPERPAPDPEITTQRVLTERFIAACAGGDITELMAVLDPDVDGEAILIGRGPFVQLSGRPAVAQKLLGLFGSGSDRLLVPVAIEDHHGVVAFEHGRVAAVILLDEADGRIRHIHTFVRGPAKRKAGRFTA